MTSTVDLERLRNWRTALVTVTAFGQGVQYLLKPGRALASPAFGELTALGLGGWQLIGILLVLAAFLLAGPWRTAGYVAAGLLYGFLTVAVALHGYWPGTLLLPVGLALGEVSQMGLERARRRRPQ